MAANIALAPDGSPMIASKNILPWHQQGTVFTEDISGQEMLKRAHLDWDVMEAPVYADTGIIRVSSKPTGWDNEKDAPIFGNVMEDIKPRQIKGKKTVYRSDTGEPLGIVGDDYKVFQNASMIQTFENLVNGHKIVYEVAGGLGGGESVWVLARIPDMTMDILGDAIEKYMLIRTGHIGNMMLAIFPTATRVVCQNTITIANQGFRERLGKGKNKRKMDVHTGYQIRHTSGMMRAVEAVEKAYAEMLGDFTLTEEMFKAMVGKQFDTEMKNRFFSFVVDPLKDEAERAKELSKAALTRQSNKTEVLEKLLESETNQTAASKGTVWGLYNAAVEYIDFHRGTRCTDGTDTNACKFESAMFGSGAALKDAAFTKAMELVTA